MFISAISASLRGLALIAFIALGVAGIVGVLSWLDEAHGRLPKRVAFEAVIFSDSFWGGREGCWYAEYSLSPETIAGLTEGGLAYLGDDTHPEREDPHNPYAKWRATPLVKHSETYWTGAEEGCGKTGKKYDVRAALQAPGSYYTLTANFEGMIVVDPVRGVAFFLYFG